MPTVVLAVYAGGSLGGLQLPQPSAAPGKPHPRPCTAESAFGFGQAEPYRFDGGLGPARHLQGAKDRSHVCLDGTLGETQLAADRLVRRPLREQPQYGQLAIGQIEWRGPLGRLPRLSRRERSARSRQQFRRQAERTGRSWGALTPIKARDAMPWHHH